MKRNIFILIIICFSMMNSSCFTLIGLVTEGVKETVVEPDYLEEQTATVLIWGIVRKHEGVTVSGRGVKNNWYGSGSKTPMVIIPAGVSTFAFDCYFSNTIVKNVEITHNFQAGREYFICWYFEEKPNYPRWNRHFKYHIQIYDKMPKKKKYDFKVPGSKSGGFATTREGRAMQPNLIVSYLMFETDKLDFSRSRMSR